MANEQIILAEEIKDQVAQQLDALKMSLAVMDKKAAELHAIGNEVERQVNTIAMRMNAASAILGDFVAREVSRVNQDLQAQAKFYGKEGQ